MPVPFNEQFKYTLPVADEESAFKTLNPNTPQAKSVPYASVEEAMTLMTGKYDTKVFVAYYGGKPTRFWFSGGTTINDVYNLATKQKYTALTTAAQTTPAQTTAGQTTAVQTTIAQTTAVQTTLPAFTTTPHGTYPVGTHDGLILRVQQGVQSGDIIPSVKVQESDFIYWNGLRHAFLDNEIGTEYRAAPTLDELAAVIPQQQNLLRYPTVTPPCPLDSDKWFDLWAFDDGFAYPPNAKLWHFRARTMLDLSCSPRLDSPTTYHPTANPKGQLMWDFDVTRTPDGRWLGVTPDSTTGTGRAAGLAYISTDAVNWQYIGPVYDDVRWGPAKCPDYLGANGREGDGTYFYERGTGRLYYMHILVGGPMGGSAIVECRTDTFKAIYGTESMLYDINAPHPEETRADDGLGTNGAKALQNPKYLEVGNLEEIYMGHVFLGYQSDGITPKSTDGMHVRTLPNSGRAPIVYPAVAGPVSKTVEVDFSAGTINQLQGDFPFEVHTPEKLQTTPLFNSNGLSFDSSIRPYYGQFRRKFYGNIDLTACLSWDKSAPRFLFGDTVNYSYKNYIFAGTDNIAINSDIGESNFYGVTTAYVANSLVWIRTVFDKSAQTVTLYMATTQAGLLDAAANKGTKSLPGTMYLSTVGTGVSGKGDWKMDNAHVFRGSVRYVKITGDTYPVIVYPTPTHPNNS